MKHRDPVSDIARLGELHHRDPEAFEELRRRIIEEAIDQFPAEHRARAYGLQFRLDHELSLYKDPISRMNRMVEIFWDGVREFESAIRDPEQFIEEKKRSAPGGKVIPFVKKDDSLH